MSPFEPPHAPLVEILKDEETTSMLPQLDGLMSGWVNIPLTT
jgi:hypothetical protein